MLRRRWRIIAAMAALLVAGGWLIVRFGPSPLHAQPRVITLDAAQWRYTPGIITVNEGDPITLKIQSADVMHGFYLDGYGITRAVVPGETTEIRFVAAKAGRWMYRCSVTCGPFHPYMTGWLRVQPNLPLRFGWLAVGVLGIGAMVIAWEEARGR